MTHRIDPGGIEKWVVVLISVHSLLVGVLLLGFTDWGLAFGGWGRAEPRFFAWQAGVFHIVVALGYLLEYARYRGVGLLLLAKTIAVVFLLTVTLSSEQIAWIVPLSALGDGTMALAVLVVRRWAVPRVPRAGPD